MKIYTSPGKVFLLGEYNVLVGGHALLMAVPPLFQLKATPEGLQNNRSMPFSPQSPAGLLWKSKKLNYALKWEDPYETPIGVGSSSAQFLTCYELLAELENTPLQLNTIMQTYWSLVGETQGLRPSGADIAIQHEGGVGLFKNAPLSFEKIPARPSDKVEFLLAFTGSKMKTHEHLLELKAKGFPEKFSDMFRDMEKLVQEGCTAFINKNWQGFGDTMNVYHHVMKAYKLSQSPILKTIATIQSWPGVLGCKGSGAQGGDSVLLLIDKQHSPEVRSNLNKLNWPVFELNTHEKF